MVKNRESSWAISDDNSSLFLFFNAPIQGVSVAALEKRGTTTYSATLHCENYAILFHYRYLHCYCSLSKTKDASLALICWIVV